MSALSQKQTSGRVGLDVCFWPKADMVRVTGQLSSLSEGQDVAVAVPHEQLTHTIDSVYRSLDDIGFLGTQLC